MAVQKHRKAYPVYRQVVYRAGRNPTFWCSISVLYYSINPAPSPLMRADQGIVDNFRYPGRESDSFRGRAPPPLNLNESASRRSSFGALALLEPMELEREGDQHYPGPPRSRGPSNGPPPPIELINDLAPPPGPGGRGPLLSTSSRNYYDQHEGSSRRHYPPGDSPRIGSHRTTNLNSLPATYTSRSYPLIQATPTLNLQGLLPPITSAYHGLITTTVPRRRPSNPSTTARPGIVASTPRTTHRTG